MVLADLFQNLLVFFAGSRNNADFVVAVLTAVVGNPEKDKASIFDQSVKFLDGVVRGYKKIKLADTRYLLNNQNPLSLKNFFLDNMPTSADVLYSLGQFIESQGFTDDGSENTLAEACSKITIHSLEERLATKRGRKPNSVKTASLKPEPTSQNQVLIENIDAILASMSAPKQIEVPLIPEDEVFGMQSP